MKKKTLVDHLVETLETLQVGEVMPKVAFIKLHWYEYNYFTGRSFDVAFNKAKTILANKKFDGKLNKEIKRIS